MNLFIQIPCLNEADQIAQTIACLPRKVAGFDRVCILVIDDGSQDDTASLAAAAGADYVIRNTANRGLAYTYLRGLEECLNRGADVVINYDADRQYSADSIPELVGPILRGEAEMVVGARPIGEISHFSPAKKIFQRLGSWVVRQSSGLNVVDAPSGFRAVTRHAAMQLYVFSSYSYTLETLIQAGRSNMVVASVPIKVNPPVRRSRLMKNSLSYVLRSAGTILRISFLYFPFRIMLWAAVIVAAPGILVIGRFLIQYMLGDGVGRIQSLILGSALVGVSMLLVVGGLLADLLAANRRLLQEIRFRQLGVQINRGDVE